MWMIRGTQNVLSGGEFMYNMVLLGQGALDENNTATVMDIPGPFHDATMQSTNVTIHQP